MKQLFTCALIICAAFSSVSAQQNVKKYVLMEHFTNTLCGVCAANNPGYYTTINAQAANVHHVSIHSSIPYSACVFYQANTAPQNARASYYGLSGTPSVSVNGANLVSVSNITAASLTTEAAKASPIAVRVTEISGVAGYTANIGINTYNTVPAGTYKLFVALVEKTVNYNAPNGEGVHRDVFRQFLTPTAGADIILPAIGGSVNTPFNYSIATTWNANQIYVMAFVQEVNTKMVLNSGTRFDPNLTASEEVETQKNIKIFPNPISNGQLQWVGNINDATTQSVQIFNLLGQNVLTQKTWAAGETLDISTLKTGVYELHLTNSAGQLAIQKIVVQ